MKTKGGFLKPVYVLCVLLLNQLLFAEPRSLSDTLIANSKNFGRNCAHMAAAPFHASTKKWLTAGGFIGGIAASAALDNSVRTNVRRFDRSVAKTMDDLGHAYQ